jgi:hypothetical protein
VSLQSRIERILLVATPAVAMATVAIGLHIGGRDGVRSAVVRGAPPAGGSIAWQVVVFDEDNGVRQPVPGLPIDVEAHEGSASATWQGATNVDGVAEPVLKLPGKETVSLVIRADKATLAQGDVAPGAQAPGESAGPAAATPASSRAAWLRYARREGSIALDVALMGERAAPGFPAELWVRARDTSSHAPLAGVTVTLNSDTSLSSASNAAATTDSRGWTRVVATPVGLAVNASLVARGKDGRAGTWTGGLYMSPGGPRVQVPSRVPPATPFAIEVITPTARNTEYIEIVDARGRAWATATSPTPRSDGTASAHADVTGLTPGLYWAVAASDPAGAAELGAGSVARPFFVADSDDAALLLGTDAGACSPSRDVREMAGAVGSCLALAALAPVPRPVVLDGFLQERELEHTARSRGLTVALGGLLIAAMLEAVLLLRAGAGSRRRTAVLATLVGLLGLALLAAFIVRV